MSSLSSGRRNSVFRFKGVKIVEEKALGTRLAREEGGRGGWGGFLRCTGKPSREEQ